MTKDEASPEAKAAYWGLMNQARAQATRLGHVFNTSSAFQVNEYRGGHSECARCGESVAIDVKSGTITGKLLAGHCPSKDQPITDVEIAMRDAFNFCELCHHQMGVWQKIGTTYWTSQCKLCQAGVTINPTALNTREKMFGAAVLNDCVKFGVSKK